MNSRVPEPLSALVAQLSRLPGLGPKSAMRVAMTLLKWPEAQTRTLGQSIAELRDRLRLCSRCGGLSSSDPCPICADPTRDRDTLCLVTEWDSMLTLDEGGFYRGQYMILGGLLAPLEHMDADSLELDRLTQRLAEGEITELILALGATIEAENTASFLLPPGTGHPPGRGSQIHGQGNPAAVAPVPAAVVMFLGGRQPPWLARKGVSFPPGSPSFPQRAFFGRMRRHGFSVAFPAAAVPRYVQAQQLLFL